MSLDLLRHTFCNESSGLQVITWFVLYAVPNEHCWYIPPTSGHELWSAIKFYTCLYFSASKTSSVYTNSSLAGFGVEAFGDRKWTMYIATANVSLCWPLSRFLPFPGICFGCWRQLYGSILASSIYYKLETGLWPWRHIRLCYWKLETVTMSSASNYGFSNTFSFCLLTCNFIYYFHSRAPYDLPRNSPDPDCSLSWAMRRQYFSSDLPS